MLLDTEETDYAFNIICLSQTWSTDKDFSDNSNYQLQNYDAIHFQRKLAKRRGGLLIYVNEKLTFRIREDLNMSNCDGEFLSVKIINSSSKNYIVTCCYRPPNSNVKNFSSQLNKNFDKANSEKKDLLFWEI